MSNTFHTEGADFSRGSEFHELSPLEFTAEQFDGIRAHTDDPGNPETLAQVVDLIANDAVIDDAIQAHRQQSGIQSSGTTDALQLGHWAASRICLTLDRATEDHQSLPLIGSINERVGIHLLANFGTLKNTPVTELPQQSNQVLKATATTLKKRPDVADDIMNGMRSLFTRVQILKSMQAQLEGLRLPTKESRFAPNLAEQNYRLFDATRTLQKYGVASSYVRDGSAFEVVDWHVYDWSSVVEDMSDKEAPEMVTARLPSLARFDGFNGELLDTTAEIVEVDDVANEKELSWEKGGIVVLDYRGLVKDHPDWIIPTVQFDLSLDGSLHLTYGASLAAFADQLGVTPEYEMMRAQALSNFMDMVVPAYLIDGDHGIQEANQAAHDSTRARSRDFLNMVLARQRLLNNPDEITDAIEAEMRGIRTVRRHGIVGFLRALPNNHTASHRARELCIKEQGEDLILPGETYVRRHKRGGNATNDDGEPLPPIAPTHRALVRRIGATATRRADDN